MICPDVVTLIAQTFTENDAGDSIPTESERTVYCDVQSIGLKRKLEAMEAGLKLEYKFVLSDVAEYEGENILEYKGTRYNIINAYTTEQHSVELVTARY